MSAVELPLLDATDLEQMRTDLARWPIHRIRTSGIALFGAEPDDSQGAVAAIADVPTTARMSALESWLGRGVRWHRIARADLDVVIEREEQTRLALAAIESQGSVPAQPGDRTEILSLEALDRSDSPVVRFVNAALYDALRIGASDVHFESTREGITVRYRIDGVLVPGASSPGQTLANQVLSRLKVMADLDIAERRIPQDGRFVVVAMERRVDFRVSVMPSSHGEDAVVRLLDKRHLIQSDDGLRLESLGFDAPACETLRFLARQPYGMLLVTGPTGSGKTTTLYALISEVYDGTEKIVTIEDPIEYQLGGILQIPVNEKKGLTFARGLRSILRHDPDRIMVGEIRDADTADIAIQSALTGHAVFTTVHANNVFDVVGRFTHMRIDLDNFVASLNGIVAQRLIRLVCRACARPVDPDPAELVRAGLTGQTVSSWRLLLGMGCAACRGTGYQGRAAVSEHLILDDESRQAIRDRMPFAEIRRLAARRGYVPLREQGWYLVRSGRTTISEINRVTLSDVHVAAEVPA